MKRIAPIFLILILLFLTACSVKEYTPELPATFTQGATFSSGDFSYDCEICKNDEYAMVTVESSSAAGMIMSCNGTNLIFNYSDYEYSYDADKFASTNSAIIIYEVFEAIKSEDTRISKIDNGYKYYGKIPIGDFELIQNDDNTLNSLTIKSADISIIFK